jgi:hypothetical protein
MGRTVSSSPIALGMEKEKWKPSRNALDKSDKKKFSNAMTTAADSMRCKEKNAHKHTSIYSKHSKQIKNLEGS